MTDSYRIERAQIPELDAMLGTPIPALDKGFVRVIDYMGSDDAIVQAARVSYGTGTKKLNEDKGLIRYLLRHRHTTPFEMCEIKLHVKLPIFVARQWVRHRTANINEYSARYSIMDKEFYIPEQQQLAAQHQHNKQGRGEKIADDKKQQIIDYIQNHSDKSYEDYEWLINEMGLARELARSSLPVNIYTQWYWKIDLHNLLHFIALRQDAHAQYEIRAYANILADIVKKWVPVTYAAFENYIAGGAHISKDALAFIKAQLNGNTQQANDIIASMSAGEKRELYQLLELENEDEG